MPALAPTTTRKAVDTTWAGEEAAEEATTWTAHPQEARWIIIPHKGTDKALPEARTVGRGLTGFCPTGHHHRGWGCLRRAGERGRVVIIQRRRHRAGEAGHHLGGRTEAALRRGGAGCRARSHRRARRPIGDGSSTYTIASAVP